MRSIDIKIDIIKFRAKIQHNLPKCLTNQNLLCKMMMIYKKLRYKGTKRYCYQFSGLTETEVGIYDTERSVETK